jgi:ABC-type uncharacterized transport system permease subunit
VARDDTRIDLSSLIIGLIVGAVLAAAVTFVVTRPPTYPHQQVISGVVQGFNGDHTAFAFTPQGGRGTSYPLSHTLGAALLKAGAEVSLTVVSVRNGPDVVVAVRPKG